jgi:hypothetical protein
MTRLRIALAICTASIVAAAVAIPSQAATKRFYATLSGTQEVPSKGDPDGSASVTLRISGDKGICYVIRPRKLETPKMAHIHTGRKGKAGGILVDLFTTSKRPMNGRIAGCAKITAAQIQQISTKPSGFYVNLHTTKYPSGAVRGQLSTKKPRG